MVTGSYDGTARLWDLTNTKNRTEPIVLEGHQGWIGAVAVSPDGRWVATGSYDNTARLWNTETIDSGAGPIVLEGHQGRIHAVAFSHDGRWLVTGSFDQTARIWDLGRRNPAESPIVLRGHTAPVSSLAISPDNRWLATSSGDIRREHDCTVRLWDLNVDGLLDSAREIASSRMDEGECTEILLDAMGQGRPVR
jgi:WD40 repeat protein